MKTREWVRFLWSRWLVIVIVGIIGVALGVVYAIVKKPKYTGTLTFVLSNDSKTGGGLSSLAGQFGLDLGAGGGDNGAFEGDNIVGLLKSDRIIKGALLKKVPGSNELLGNVIGERLGFFKAWKTKDRLKDAVPFTGDAMAISPLQDSLAGVIERFLSNKYLDIGKPDKKLSFYQVSTTSPDETLSIYLTKNIVDEAAKMYIETKTKTSRSNLDMLQHEADSIKGRLGGTIVYTANAVDQTFNLNPALQAQRATVQQSQVQMQVLTIAYGEVVKNLEMAKITLQKETPLYQIIDEPRYPLVMHKTSKLIAGMIGGIVLGLLCILYLVGRKAFRQAMEEQ